MGRERFAAWQEPSDEVRFLRSEVSRLEHEEETAYKARGGLKVLFADLLSSVQAIRPPKIVYKAPRKTKVSKPIVHVSHWTDWHLGAVQLPDEIEGFNEFDPDILRAGIMNCVRDQLDWVGLHRSNYVVDETVDLVTGDLISGDIHPELSWTNAFPVPVQAIRAGELLAEVVATKSQHYKRVRVEFVTVDNHGRLTKKPQSVEAGLNCWGYVIGAYAKERLRDCKNVTFNLHPMVQTTVSVAGRRYLLVHGDRVRGWAGFPYYGIERKVGREAVKRMRRDLGKFDRVIMGHWHAPLAHPWYWIGGSASGTTAYDHAEGRESDPMQTSWLVHPQHGEFDRVDWSLSLR